jgi:PKD repeat protein
VVFDGSPSTGQSPIVSWQWQFGDGRNASGMVVQHAFAAPGTFAVQLTVTDQRGQTNTATSQILVLPPPTGVPTQTPLPTATLPPPPTNQPPVPPTATNVPPPTATPPPEIVPPQASVNAPSIGYIGEPVKIDASGSRPGSSPIVSYTWSFGNGTGQPASPNPTITATYNTTGMYEITVVVADSNGQTSSTSTIITINARLATRAWTLSTINGQPLLPGSAITLQFLSGQLAGFAGCNDYNGSYTAIDNGDGTFGVTIDRLTTGRRSCPQDVMAQEDNFTKLIQTATSAAIQENRLTLSGPDGQLVFYLVTGP